MITRAKNLRSINTDNTNYVSNHSADMLVPSKDTNDAKSSHSDMAQKNKNKKSKKQK